MIETTPDGAYRVTCAGGCSRPLSRTVAGGNHAYNLEQKHNREHHADPAFSPEAIRELSDVIAAAADIAVPATTIAHAVLAAGYVKAPF